MRDNVSRTPKFRRPAFWPVGQRLAGHWRAVVCTVALAATAAACRSSDAPASAPASRTGIPRGGTLTLSTRAEPRSFFRLTARDTTTALISDLTQAKLVRINKVTDDVEPWLAESWTRSADARRYTLKLRDGVVFSDGVPFTSDDVVFTFRAIYDEKTGGTLADSLEANGKRLQVKAIDPHTVEIAFAEPFGPGVRLLDNLPVFPKHVLEPLLDAGKLASAWTVSTPPSQVVGLGPFVIASYTPGERVVFARNPKYFRKAPDGGPLPYVDRISLEIIPDQNAELLRLEAGQVDMTRTEIAPDSYAPLRRAADAGRVQLVDLGIGYTSNSLWFNLRPGAFAGDPRAKWLQRDELRSQLFQQAG